MPIYTLYLTTFANPNWINGTPVNNTSKHSVRWNINFDEMFRNENYKYKHCRVRLKLQMTSWSAVSTDWESYLGYLSCSLASATSNYGTYGTLLCPTFAVDAPTTGTATHCMILDTTTDIGVDVMMPTGNQDLLLNFHRMDMTKNFMANIYDYQCILYFELYD